MSPALPPPRQVLEWPGIYVYLDADGGSVSGTLRVPFGGGVASFTGVVVAAEPNRTYAVAALVVDPATGRFLSLANNVSGGLGQNESHLASSRRGVVSMLLRPRAS